MSTIRFSQSHPSEALGLHPVRVLPEDRVFVVEEGEDVLTAGLRQGIDLRYGCRHGKCTTCKYVVVEGDVVHHGASPYAFSDRELEEGGVLLCSTFARSPLVIRPFGGQPRADGFGVIPPEERRARVVSLSPASVDLMEVRLRPDAPLAYRPGQYVEIVLPGTDERRSYSMTGLPRPAGDLVFLVDASHRRVLQALSGAAGPVTVLGPFGRLFHRPADRPILMAATGAGIAPLLAVLKDLRESGATQPVRLYYGARPGGIPSAGELAEPPFEFEPVELPGDGPLRLRLGPLVRRIGKEVRDASGHDAYVAGPVELCDAVESLLTAKGLPERRFFGERFY
ncbi:MAG: 2Fe-2S iron-sulfur cluster binding domain-containing protein [Actinobacteria bacterium]|nr:2Fe-2S iron-sulfur cluster binding domain-containing protein [Actinomycetota bacterium]